jgi:hypothetical protein
VRVLGFEVGVNDPTYPVEEVEAHQHLSGDFLDDFYWEAFAVVLFEDLPEVDSEYFEDHAEVVAVRTFVEEGVEEVQYVAVVPVDFGLIALVFLQGLYPFGVQCVFGYFLQDLNLGGGGVTSS